MIVASAELALISESSPTQLRKEVTSPGGVTQRAIEEFDTNGLKRTILEAIEEAAKKSKELGES